MAVNEKPILGPLASLQERAAAAKTLPCCAFSQPGVNIAAVNLEWDEHRCLTGRLLDTGERAMCPPRSRWQRRGLPFSEADAALQVGAID